MTEQHACCPQGECHGVPPVDDRRLVVKILAGAVGLLAGLIPGAAALYTFFDPATRRERKYAAARGASGPAKTDDGYIRVAALAEVPTDGTPLRKPIRDDVTNKWTFSPGEPVGEVFLRRIRADAPLTAFTTVCPHLGCAISLAKGSDGKAIFKCPCHNSSFQIDGQMIQPTPSPRDMDDLQTKIVDGAVYVKYENFYTGRTVKKAKH